METVVGAWVTCGIKREESGCLIWLLSGSFSTPVLTGLDPSPLHAQKSSGSRLLSVCTVVVMSCLVNMSSDVMSYASQSGHAIYCGSRGIGLEKNLRCSLVLEQNLQF